VEKVTADVAAGDAQLGAHQRDHDVREVLADAGVGGEREVDRRIHLGRLGLVVEVFVDLLVQLVQHHQRVVPALHVKLIGERIERRRWRGKLAGEEHLPVVALFDHAVELGPGVGREEGGNLRRRRDLHQRLGHDHQLAVLPRDVEVVDLVGQMVAVAEDAATRAHREMKRQAALVLVGARMHARLHHALAYRVGVEELGEMADRVIH
jgi:hypothetical protein